MKILFLGDTHGNTAWVKRVFEHYADQNIDRIVQLGDFGIWPGAAGVKFREKVSKYAEKYGIPVYFIDGNHEDFDKLWGKLTQNSTLHNGDDILNSAGFLEILPGLFYIPRGTVWEWDGIRFAGVGGAVSIDREYRLSYERATGQKIWWEQEQLTDYDQSVIELFDGTVDVLVSHDTYINPVSDTSWYKNDPESTAHRLKMLDVVSHLQPRVNIHGHYHYRHTTQDYRALVVGLGKDDDGFRNACLVVDTARGLDDFALAPPR